MPLNILIIGAGIGGPALAALLQNSAHRYNITVLERYPSLRVTGQQIDLKGEGLSIMRKMSLLDTIKSHTIAEIGIGLVDGNGKPLMQFYSNDTNKGAIGRSVTSDYEIMRGDLVKVLYDASLKRTAKVSKEDGKARDVIYEFGKTVTELNQSGDGVNVTFSDGQKGRYDLVVGADGQGSRTRRLAFAQQGSDEAFKSLGIHAAFYSIPRVEGEGELAKAYIAPGRRGIMTRTGDRSVTQVFLFSMIGSASLTKVTKEPVEKQKEVWVETFQGAGWETPRFLGGLKTCSDFYSCELGQVKLTRLYSGRVVLLGDAGYCPSVLTGMGTTSSLVGAYVLAGELTRHGNDIGTALKSYDTVMKAPILEYHSIPTGGPGSFWPSSRLAVWILHNTIWAISTFKIDKMIQRMIHKGEGAGYNGWTIPEYPELNLDS